MNKMRGIKLALAAHKRGEDALLAALWLTCVVKARTSHHSVQEAFNKIVKAA